MKVAISSKGKTIESDVESVFGRCNYFLLVEIENKEIKSVIPIKNDTEKMVGAGISSAKMIVEKGAQAVITGNMGPNAMSVLIQFNVKTYFEEGKISDVLRKLIDKKVI